MDMEKIIAILIDAFILNMDAMDITPHTQDGAEKKNDDVTPPANQTI